MITARCIMLRVTSRVFEAVTLKMTGGLLLTELASANSTIQESVSGFLTVIAVFGWRSPGSGESSIYTVLFVRDKASFLGEKLTNSLVQRRQRTAMKKRSTNMFGGSELIPNIVHLREKVVNVLPKLLFYAMKTAQKLVLMRQIRGSVAFFQKVPKSFGSVESTKLETDGASTSIVNPSDNLVVLAIPLLKSIRVCGFVFVNSFFRFSDITSNISSKFSALKKTSHCLSPDNIVRSIHGDGNRGEGNDVGGERRGSSVEVAAEIDGESDGGDCSSNARWRWFFLKNLRIFKDRATMRAPSLIAQCLPGLLPHDRGNHATISERDIHLPSPAVEILPSKTVHPFKYAGENVDLQGINIFKGRVSVADIIGFTNSEMISSKSNGFLKSWEISFVLVNALKNEIRDGQLSFRGKRVLELGCSYGLPGIFACLKGACTVHFQDLSAETIRCTTLPNVLTNLEQARDRQSRQPESPLTPSRQILAPEVHFYAGGWEELHTVLSVVRNDGFEMTAGISQTFSEEDMMDGYSSQDGSIIDHESSSRRSKKLSGSRAWERASETDQGEGGYDVILMTEIPYSVTSLKKLYMLIKKCLRPPYGVLYLATKKNYISSNGGARFLRGLVDEEGIFGAHVVAEMADRETWKFFLK
ncbi:hypothetical protein HHK36_020088 [Tetracentron sinense]|uniref:Uncharacterized protein n=1 Tax=Tetracentron sinense TaxID=13715 RepID=A0A834YTG5_TETSI|nr:hypothetical protein HHK36_020088 [Tetracentron sinense]